MGNEDIESLLIDYKGYKNQLITINDMPSGTFQLVADNCGLDVAVSLLLNMGGITISVPSNGLEALDRRIILKEYDYKALTIKKLAIKLNLSEKTVRNYITNAGAIDALEGQITLLPDDWQNINEKKQ